MGSYEDTLTNLGFTEDPFAYRLGEQPPIEFLEATWVDFPNGDKMLNLNQSSVLLAPPGSGKTTWRRYLEKKIAENEQFLTVVYNQFTIPIHQAIQLNDHQNQLLRQIARAVFDRLISKGLLPSDHASDDSTSSGALWWHIFLAQHLPDYNQPALKQLFPSHPEPLPQWGNITDLQEILLRELLPKLPTIGLERLYVLVDDLDGTLETQNPDVLAALIKPLVNNTHLLSNNRLIWKFFAPVQLQAIVEVSHGYRTGRFDSLFVKWDIHTLADLLRLRLSYASEGTVSDISQLFDGDVLQEGNPTDEICQLALQNEFLGSPRTLLTLGKTLFSSISETVILKPDWELFLQQERQSLNTNMRANAISKPCTNINLAILKEILQSRFNRAELKDVCFDLRINYDDLSGNIYTEKVIEFIAYLERYNRCAEFLEYARIKRSDIDWVIVTYNIT